MTGNHQTNDVRKLLFELDFSCIGLLRHTAFHIMITCAVVRRYGFLLRAPMMYVARTVPCYRGSCCVVFRILGVSPEVYRHIIKLTAPHPTSLPMDFGGLNVASLALDVEPSQYASFDATLASLITHYESESVGPLFVW
jgi:hypothetical protein